MASRRRRPAGGDGPGRSVLYGKNAVREALRGRRRVFRVWTTERQASAIRGLVRSSSGPAASIAQVGGSELELLCGSPDHGGVACEVAPYPYAEPSGLLEREDALVVALDQVQDPQNLGAICRTAECAGAAGVVVPERHSAEVTPAVCRASAGAVEHLSVARVRNLADFLADAKRSGAWVYGAEAGGPGAYTEPDYAGRVVLVLGSEGSGLRPRVRGACDAVVSLPVRGEVGSLNVSAAAAVLVYEALRNRGLDKSP